MISAKAIWPSTYSIGNIHGEIVFEQISENSPVLVTIDLHNVPTGVHGLHIHERGFRNKADLEKGCAVLGGHFNPTNAQHGSVWLGTERHAGDLINNVLADANGNVQCYFLDGAFNVSEIIGRSVVLHGESDDLGSESHLHFEPIGCFAVPLVERMYDDDARRAESLRTGNAGKRIACANISEF